ncbi:hypothetical protein AOQ72_08615 [Bradyrhizobium yuanmingense]|uniref:Glycosyl transferase family 1 domain-containing protein n=1 Tax=Bradyrhizobium yuanmingense TaxID=108015 RepID=A0A0R3CZE4_9BRAD|nr:glycosyltransferase [Bradyrhizobium yuanmingense]KRQ01518.1 hypothetical protein AOQ72_08615 [Bradyrhizobium yuanmingense]
MKITIWHNIMWSRYKAVVFSALHRQARATNIDVNVYQIAETDVNRTTLSPIDLKWHNYPFVLLFKGALSEIPTVKLYLKMAWLTWKNTANVTILSGYERPVVWLQAAILKLKRKPFALFCDSTMYDQPPNLFKGIAKRVIFNSADGMFCYGQRAVQYVNHYGVPKDRIFIRRQAAALPDNYSEQLVVQQRASMRSPSPRYLYVGRFSPEKSLPHLLQAFHGVVQSLPNSELVLVGAGPTVESLKALAAELGIIDKVTFAGSKSGNQLFDEYLKATCLVLPSKSEPWGLVVNEALSFGCPAVVSHRCGCAPELVRNEETGFIFEWGDIAQLTERLIVAPEVFSNASATTTACLEQIAPFNPDSAAAGIIAGCLKISGRRSAETI